MSEQEYKSKQDAIESTYQQKLNEIVEIRNHFEQRVASQSSDKKILTFD